MIRSGSRKGTWHSVSQTDSPQVSSPLSVMIDIFWSFKGVFIWRHHLAISALITLCLWLCPLLLLSSYLSTAHANFVVFYLLCNVGFQLAFQVEFIADYDAATPLGFLAVWPSRRLFEGAYNYTITKKVQDINTDSDAVCYNYPIYTLDYYYISSSHRSFPHSSALQCNKTIIDWIKVLYSFSSSSTCFNISETVVAMVVIEAKRVMIDNNVDVVY